MAELNLRDDGQRFVISTSYMERDLIKQVPGSAYDPKNSTWTAPKSWAVACALRGVFGDALTSSPEVSAWAKEEHERRIVPCFNLRDAVDADGSDDLYPFQRAGVQFCGLAEGAILGDEMGAGKTVQLINTLMTLEDPFPTLIVAPNSVTACFLTSGGLRSTGMKLSGTRLHSMKMLWMPSWTWQVLD